MEAVVRTVVSEALVGVGVDSGVGVALAGGRDSDERDQASLADQILAAEAMVEIIQMAMAVHLVVVHAVTSEALAMVVHREAVDHLAVALGKEEEVSEVAAAEVEASVGEMTDSAVVHRAHASKQHREMLFQSKFK